MSTLDLSSLGWYNVTQFARRHNMSRQTVYKHLREGALIARTLNKKGLYLNEDENQKYLETKMVITKR